MTLRATKLDEQLAPPPNAQRLLNIRCTRIITKRARGDGFHQELGRRPGKPNEGVAGYRARISQLESIGSLVQANRFARFRRTASGSCLPDGRAVDLEFQA